MIHALWDAALDPAPITDVLETPDDEAVGPWALARGLGHASVERGFDREAHYASRSDGRWTIRPRPKPPGPVRTAYAAGETLRLSGLAPGSVWRLVDVSIAGLEPAPCAGGVVGGDGRLSDPLEEAGRYRLTVEPPFPHVGLSAEIEVT